jgi:hypothetical protein
VSCGVTSSLKCATLGIFQDIRLLKGKVTEIKQGHFSEGSENRMLRTKPAHCSETGSTEGASMQTNLMKCLEVFEETKWPADSGVCLF